MATLTLKYSWQHSRTLTRLNIFFSLSNSGLNRSTVFYFENLSIYEMNCVYIICIYIYIYSRTNNKPCYSNCKV